MAQDLEQDRRDADLRAVMALPAGRRLLYRIVHSIARLEFDPTGVDDRETNRNLGGQAVGRFLRAELQRVALHAYLEMMQERITTEQHELELSRRRPAE